MPEIATEPMRSDQMPPFAVASDGSVFLNGKPLMIPVRPKSDTIAALNDIIILLATACSSAVMVKQAVDQVLEHGKQ